ncbi:hypothetical protein AB1Y20_016310 [Prymnesium parvum]|uniref:Glutathione transferase n=1 Tax=Prymnesium parvum TaxID=97485 RepID=A0AB34IFJ9_PRYPA
MKLTLVGSANFFRGFRNAWMLEELGAAWHHDPAKPRSKAARSVNPFGKVPTLLDGDITIYDSVAINNYLGDKFRELRVGPTLIPPPGTALRARYEQLVCTTHSELDAQGLWIHRKHASEVAQYLGGLNPEATEVARKHSLHVIDVLADELAQSGGPYLLGHGFSAADILLVHCMDWAEHIGWWSASDYQPGERTESRRLREYVQLCRERPAYKKAKALP